MNNLIKKSKDSHKLNIKFNEKKEYTGLDVYEIKKGETFKDVCPSNQELCVVIVTGYASVTLADKQYGEMGNRASVFEDEIAHALYVSATDSYKLEAKTNLEIAICRGHGTGKYPSRIIQPERSTMEHRGYGQIKRTAKNILPETEEAESLLIVEVITEGGNWSSFPSHRHDEDNLPVQSYLEEIYYHKIDPEEKGFAFQRVYNDDESIDEAYCLRNDSAVLVKEGYHPVSVPPACNLYYLNVMAGPVRTWKFYDDPTFAHLNK